MDIIYFYKDETTINVLQHRCMVNTNGIVLQLMWRFSILHIKTQREY